MNHTERMLTNSTSKFPGLDVSGPKEYDCKQEYYASRVEFK